jgi:hypothetical protein
VIFRTLSRSFSDGAYDADDARILQAELLQASADPQAFIRDLLVEPPAQPKPESIESDEARSAIARIYSRRARAILKQLAFRSFVWAATDLQRLRVTAALAHTRVELEAVALINVMMDVPEVAWRWFSIGPDEAGRRFFQEHQVRVREILKSFDPKETYDWASSAAQHARFASIVRGISIESLESRLAIEMVVQEYEAARPESFLVFAALLLRVQERVFRAILRGLPEVGQDKIMVEGRLPRFNARVEAVWTLFRQRFPEFVRRWQASLTERLE